MRISPFKRPMWPMPESVRRALQDGGMMQAYKARPSYQRDDYVSWIADAKQPGMRAKRINQMMDELKAGDLYMGMLWKDGVAEAKNKTPDTHK